MEESKIYLQRKVKYCKMYILFLNTFSKNISFLDSMEILPDFLNETIIYTESLNFLCGSGYGNNRI